MANPLSQTNFIFRDDGNTETGVLSHALAGQNSNPSAIAAGVNFRVRFAILSTTGTSNALWPKLYFSVNGGSTWNPVSTTTPVQCSQTLQIADNTPTTQQITAEAFVADVVDTQDGVGSNITLITLSAPRTECEFGLKLDPNQVTNGQQIQLRVYHNTTAISYSVTPVINVSKPSTLFRRSGNLRSASRSPF
jgi:hypothetical protein